MRREGQYPPSSRQENRSHLEGNSFRKILGFLRENQGETKECRGERRRTVKVDLGFIKEFWRIPHNMFKLGNIFKTNSMQNNE